MCKSLLMISDDCRSLQGMKVQSRLRLCSWSPAKCSAADFHAWVNASTHCGTRSDSDTMLLCCCLFVLLCCNHNTGTETNLVTLLWFLVSNSAKDAGTSLAQWKYVTGCHCKVFFSAVTLLVGQWEQYLACNKPLLVLKPGQSLCLWLGNWTLLTHGLCKILWIPYTRHVANTKSGRLLAVLQFPTLLKRDGSAPKQDDYRVIVMSLRPSSCWTLWTPSYHWLWGIDTDVQSVNIRIHSAWRKTSDCMLWWHIVDMATLFHGEAIGKEK